MRAAILTACCYLAGTVFFIGGCNPGGGEYKPVQSGKNKTDDTFGHDHHDEHGPHNGAVIELGKHEYHGELVLDEKTKIIGIYLYGPDLKTPVPTDAKSVTLNLKVEGKLEQFELPAKPLEGEAGGKSSHFELAAPAEVAEHLTDVEDLEGELQLVINGKPYAGGFKPHHHEPGDHKDAGHNDELHKFGDHKDADPKDGKK
ncbi:MAG: hypothetical protein WD648_14530 [Planctomycetaceae bacterium]